MSFSHIDFKTATNGSKTIRQFETQDLGGEKTVILSTHILPEVEATCDRIFIINKGKIVADGTAESLRKQAWGSDILKVKIEEGDLNQIFKSLQALRSVKMVDFADRKLNRFVDFLHGYQDQIYS